MKDEESHSAFAPVFLRACLSSAGLEGASGGERIYFFTVTHGMHRVCRAFGWLYLHLSFSTE